MTAKEFIQKRLNDLKSTEKTVVSLKSDKELADFIFKTIMSKKFRKFAVTPDYIPHIHQSIENAIKEGSPIKFVFVFGGYKLWRLEEAPESDWAELFALTYYAKWLKPIAEVYKPGIWMDFSSDEIIIERLNNIPKSDTEAYSKSFNSILDFLKKYLPENMNFTMTPVSSRYTPQEFEEDLKDKIDTMQKEIGGLPVLDDDSKRMIELNVRLNPDQEKDPLWREKIELVHQAYYNVSRRRSYTRGGKDKILAFCMQIGRCVPVGTTKTSVAKFWPAAGALKKTEDGFQEYVLSPSQLEKGKYEWGAVSIDGLSGKNFSKIRIFS